MLLTFFFLFGVWLAFVLTCFRVMFVLIFCFLPFLLRALRLLLGHQRLVFVGACSSCPSALHSRSPCDRSTEVLALLSCRSCSSALLGCSPRALCNASQNGPGDPPPAQDVAGRPARALRIPVLRNHPGGRRVAIGIPAWHPAPPGSGWAW